MFVSFCWGDDPRVLQVFGSFFTLWVADTSMGGSSKAGMHVEQTEGKIGPAAATAVNLCVSVCACASEAVRALQNLAVAARMQHSACVLLKTPRN